VVVLMVPPRTQGGASPESAAQDFNVSKRSLD